MIFRTFEHHKLAFYRLLLRIKSKFSKDSSDSLSTFSTTLEFLRLLVSTEPSEEDIPLTRTMTLTNAELREVISWQQHIFNHPLEHLNKYLEDSAQEDESLESLVESVQSLISILRDTTAQPKTESGRSVSCVCCLYILFCVMLVTDFILSNSYVFYMHLIQTDWSAVEKYIGCEL